MVRSRTSASVSTSRPLALVLALLVAAGLPGLFACGGKKSAETKAPASANAPAGGDRSVAPASGSSGGETPPAVSDWRNRAAGIPPAGDPRLDDLAFLRTLPDGVDLDIAIGDYFLRHGNPDSALVAYDRALEREPANLNALNKRGITLVRLNRLDDAEAAYKKAILADSFDPHAFTNLGNLYYRRGDYTEAVDQYKLSTAIDTTDAGTWFNLGLAYEKLEQPNPAILAYNKAARTDPADPKPLERLGWIYYARGLYKGARERWQEAVDRDPSRTDLLENIRTLQSYADSTETP